jgi:hypothetical protein
MEGIDIEEIQKIYESTLEFPNVKPIPKFYLCPVGLVGSGKSTVMKLLCPKLSVLRIANDEVRKIIGNYDYYHLAPKISSTIGPKYSQLGYSIGIDANASSLWGTEEFNQRMKDLNSRQIWIHINPPEVFIKLKNYYHPWLYRDEAEAKENFEKSKQKINTDGIPFVYVFDPSRSDLNKQIDEAVLKIREELAK